MIGYTRVELYSFSQAQDEQAIKIFEVAHPDWEKRVEDGYVIFEQRYSVGGNDYEVCSTRRTRS